jgi:hypothetical protein
VPLELGSPRQLPNPGSFGGESGGSASSGAGGNLGEPRMGPCGRESGQVDRKELWALDLVHLMPVYLV